MNSLEEHGLVYIQN